MGKVIKAPNNKPIVGLTIKLGITTGQGMEHECFEITGTLADCDYNLKLISRKRLTAKAAKKIYKRLFSGLLEGDEYES